MADAPEPPEESRPQPGDSIARRLFARGATRASVGSRAEFYHRLGVDDPYAVDDGEAQAQGPFTYLSSAAYYRDLRRSRLGLLSRLSNEGPMKRVGERAQRIGPAAVSTRPSLLAKALGPEAEFELLDDPVLLARAEEEEAAAQRWPRTKPRPRRQVGPKPRPMQAAVQREIVEVPAGADELQRMIARALQSVRGSQRSKLLELLGEVQKAPESSRRAVVREGVRALRGPAAAVTRSEVLESEEASSRRVGSVAASRGTLSASKGLRPTLRQSPSILTLIEPEAVEAEVSEQPMPRRRRRVAAQAPRPQRARRTAEPQVAAPPTARLVERILRSEVASVDGGTFSAEPTTSVARAGRRTLAGRVAESEAAPLARAATGYLRDEAPARGVRPSRRRSVEMAFAEAPLEADAEEGSPVAQPRPRRRATARAVERAKPVRRSVAAPVAEGRAPLGRAPVRASSQARERVRPGARPSPIEAAGIAPRRVRGVVSAMATLLPEVEAQPEVEAAAVRRPRRRPAARSAEPSGLERAVVAEQSLAASRTTRRPVGATLDLIGEPTARPVEQATERLVARAFAGPGEQLTSSPVEYTTRARKVLGASIIDGALFALADDAEAVEEAPQPQPRRRRRAAASPATRPVRGRAAAVAVAAVQAASRIAEEPASVRAARRAVVGRTGEALGVADAPTRRNRRLLAVPTSYLEAASDEVVEAITGADAGGARRLRRAAAAAAPIATPRRERALAAAAVAPAGRVARRAEVSPASLTIDDVAAEPATVRAARRGVVAATGEALGVADAPTRRSRSLIAVPTAYLDAPSDDVVEAVAGPDASSRRPRRAAAEPTVAAERREAVTAETATMARVTRRAEAAEAPLAEERPTLRAARRAAEVPERRRMASVLAAPTAYLEAEAEEVVDDAPPLARTRRVAERIAAAVVAEVAPRGIVAADTPTERIARRAEEAGVEPSVVEAALRRAEPTSPDAPRRTPRLRPDAMAFVAPEAEVAEAAAAPRRARSTVRAVGRGAPAPRRDRSGRVMLATSVAPQLPGRRAALASTAAPSARLLARGEAPEAEALRSTLRRPVPSFALGMVLPELLEALAEEPSAEPARRRRPRATEAAAAAQAPAVLGLEEVARRTSNAVRAMERTEQSVLTFDAVRRTFGDERGPRAAARAPSVEARVEVDAQGRVLRVRATRLATGEQVLLQGDDVAEIEASTAPRPRRPAPAEWAEERAAVGVARGAVGESLVREAPGARLVERSAVPDVGARSGVTRRAQLLPGSMFSLATFDEGAEEAQEAVGAPLPGRRPAAQGVDAGRLMARGESPERMEPPAVRRSRMVPGLGPITLAAADGTDTSADTEAAPTARRRRRGPVLPPVSRAAARRTGRSSLGGTLAQLSHSDAPADPPSRRLRRRDQPELAWLDADGANFDDTVAEGPGWARRADGSSIGERKLPDIFSKPRVRTSGGLLTALARAGDPEEVVRVILQRSGDLGDASLLAPEAQRLLHRVVDEAGVVARRAGRADRAVRGSTTVAPQSKTVVTNMLDPMGSAMGNAGSGAHASATTSQGVGASKVMKLANKLMKLIHLAENDGRGDAHKHVRMAENSSEARAEGGAGATSGEQFDDKTMNIKALRQDVLDAVLRALEDLRWRREDPDGPSFWC